MRASGSRSRIFRVASRTPFAVPQLRGCTMTLLIGIAQSARLPVAAVVLGDDHADAFTRRDMARALHGVVQQRAAAVERAELLGHGVAVLVGGEAREPRAVAGREHDCPGTLQCLHASPLRLNVALPAFQV